MALNPINIVFQAFLVNILEIFLTADNDSFVFDLVQNYLLKEGIKPKYNKTK